MNKQLKILMIVHLPWRRELGGARIQLELAEEFQKLGHRVEKFSYEDAFPKAQSRFGQLTCNFSAKAKEFVKQNAHRFDIIDAHQTDLPFSKKELGFKGLLVTRSAGLIPLYRQIYKLHRLEDDEWSIKGSLRKIIHYPASRRRYQDVLPSLKESDLIIVPNKDELTYINTVIEIKNKCICLPFGLSDILKKAFLQAIRPTHERLKNKEVVFIGYWSARKGSRDWPKIVRSTLAKIPEAHFKFLGTGLSEKEVLNDFDLPARKRIKVIPHFSNEELPGLLAGATVGAFPSYIEGFGFAVLEKLAAGLPTVTYNVPGPREMMQYLEPAMMVSVADVESFSCQLTNSLKLSIEQYDQLSWRCIKVAEMFLWDKIAKDTLNTYLRFMENRNAFI